MDWILVKPKRKEVRDIKQKQKMPVDLDLCYQN